MRWPWFFCLDAQVWLHEHLSTLVEERIGSGLQCGSSSCVGSVHDRNMPFFSSAYG